MKTNRVQILIWIFLIVAVATIAGAAALLRSRQSDLPILSRFHPFTLTNQLGQMVGSSRLEGHVVVANVIFSRCPTQCHRLSLQMARLQQRLDPGVRLVSLTADPGFDTPEILRQYGQRYGADPGRWWFLTGPKSEVYRVAEKDLLFNVLDAGEANPKLEDRFIHSGTFVILDRAGRMRVVVPGEDPNSEGRIESATRQLLKEHHP